MLPTRKITFLRRIAICGALFSVPLGGYLANTMTTQAHLGQTIPALAVEKNQAAGGAGGKGGAGGPGGGGAGGAGGANGQNGQNGADGSGSGGGGGGNGGDGGDGG